jgi:WD40 repeat protein
MLQMMIPLKQTLKLSALILSIVILMACGVTTPIPIVMTTATTIPSLASINPTPTIPIPQPTLTPTPLRSVAPAPDGLRLAYVVDRNIYFEDGSKLPLQLTTNGEDSTPLFSHDGERLVFYRGLVPHELYSIHTDGAQETIMATAACSSPSV